MGAANDRERYPDTAGACWPRSHRRLHEMPATAWHIRRTGLSMTLVVADAGCPSKTWQVHFLPHALFQRTNDMHDAVDQHRLVQERRAVPTARGRRSSFPFDRASAMIPS